MHNMDLAPVKSLLLSLERDERYIVLLHYADGLTVGEIALVLDIPPLAIQATLDRLHRLFADTIRQCEAVTLHRRAHLAASA